MSKIDWTYVHSYNEALKALNKGAQNISTFDHNNRVILVGYKGNENSFSNFAKALAVNESLACLSLDENEIGPEGAKEIADALKVNISLTSLKQVRDRLLQHICCTMYWKSFNSTNLNCSLSNNYIGPEGAKEIADALKENTSLTSLDLNNNNTGPEGAKEVADALKINTSLASLHLERNAIGNEGAKEIADALKENKTLTTLNFDRNGIGDEGAKDIAHALKVNTSLTSLNFNENTIEPEGAKQIADALKINNTTTIYLRVQLSGSALVGEFNPGFGTKKCFACKI